MEAWEKMPFVENCADAPLCSDTILTAGSLCAGGCTPSQRDKQDDTQSEMISRKRSALRRVVLSAVCVFYSRSAPQ